VSRKISLAGWARHLISKNKRKRENGSDEEASPVGAERDNQGRGRRFVEKEMESPRERALIDGEIELQKTTESRYPSHGIQGLTKNEDSETWRIPVPLVLFDNSKRERFVRAGENLVTRAVKFR